MSFFADFFLSVWKNVVFLQPQNGGTVAQLVEQRTENPRVTGSIPVGTTKKRRDVNLRLFFSLIQFKAVTLWPPIYCDVDS